MDKVSKAIQKINSKDALKIADTLELLLTNKVEGLDIKKLKGHTDIFRIRVQTYRIIFKRDTDTIQILYIGKRNEKTYKNFL
jgi:mRNA interferase RelE/StbE